MVESKVKGNRVMEKREYGSIGEGIPAGIYITGKERSGETWLGELLACHKDIFTVTKESNGVRRPGESYYFSHFMNQYGKIENDEDYQRYCSDFMKSKFFVNSGADAECFKKKPLYDKYFFFHRFMMDMAEGQGKKTYIEKTQDNAIIMDTINRNLKDIRFIHVKRDIIDLVNSHLNMKGRKRNQGHERLTGRQRLKCMKVLYEAVIFDRYAEAFAERNTNILIIKYEDLMGQREDTLEEVLAFLNLAYERGLGKDLEEPVATREKEGYKILLKAGEEKNYRMIHKLLHSMPMLLLKGMNALYLNIMNRKYKRIPPNY